MNKLLYNWLKYQWKINNSNKYQKYFEEWISNLTENQILGFNKMRKKDKDYNKFSDNLNCKERRKNRQREKGKVYGHEWYIKYILKNESTNSMVKV
jgi:hypothetical protein